MDVTKEMIKVARTIGARFSLNGRPLTLEEALAPTGLLPGISRRADQLCSLCLGYGIGVSFEEVEGASLGVKVVFDDLTPHVLRMLCLTDVMFELIKGTPKGDLTSMDQLLYD